MKPRVLTPRIPLVAKTLDEPASQPWVAPGGSRFQRNHLLLPMGGAFGLSVVLILLGGDFWLADRLYALEGHAWALKSHPLLEPLIHTGGRAASLAAWLLVVVAYAWSCFDARLARWRRALAYLALTTLLATALVSGLKSATSMDCPWDLTRYGVTGRSSVFSNIARQRCLPRHAFPLHMQALDMHGSRCTSFS